MTAKEYTLTDISDSLEGLHDMAMYINSGSYTEEISEKVLHLMLDRIEDLQGMVSFMRIFPEIKAQELAESKLEIDSSKPQN